MKTMKQLADLATVINHLKVTISTAGHARFGGSDLTKLRQTVRRLDEEFVRGVLELPEEDIDAGNIYTKIREAKKALETTEPLKTLVSIENGVTLVKPPVDVPEAPPTITPAEKPVVVDDGIRVRLLEEKKKLAAKGKRTPVKKGE